MRQVNKCPNFSSGVSYDFQQSPTGPPVATYLLPGTADSDGYIDCSTEGTSALGLVDGTNGLSLFPSGLMRTYKIATGFPFGGIPASFAGNSPNNFTVNPQHGAGSNFLACDSHVKWLLPNQITAGDLPKTSTQPQIAIDPAVAEGTDSMTSSSGGKVALTFSPI